MVDHVLPIITLILSAFCPVRHKNMFLAFKHSIWPIWPCVTFQKPLFMVHEIVVKPSILFLLYIKLQLFKTSRRVQKRFFKTNTEQLLVNYVKHLNIYNELIDRLDSVLRQYWQYISHLTAVTYWDTYTEFFLSLLLMIYQHSIQPNIKDI